MYIVNSFSLIPFANDIPSVYCPFCSNNVYDPKWCHCCCVGPLITVVVTYQSKGLHDDDGSLTSDKFKTTHKLFADNSNGGSVNIRMNKRRRVLNGLFTDALHSHPLPHNSEHTDINGRISNYSTVLGKRNKGPCATIQLISRAYCNYMQSHRLCICISLAVIGTKLPFLACVWITRVNNTQRAGTKFNLALK